METLNKLGYKQTELGLIPVDWEVKSIGEIGSFKKGKGIKKDEVLPDGIPCVRYGELYTIYNDIIRTTNSFIDKSVALTSHKLKFGDILFAGSGETKEDIGKSAAFLGEVETYAGGDIVILTPREVDSAYLGYLLNLRIISKQKSQQGQGDAVVHIYPNGLSKINIPLPPKKEQTAIATALSDMDSYISSLEALIAKKRLIKQGAMQELLTPKEGWEVKKLGDCLLINPSYGINASAVKYSDYLPTYLRITDISDEGKFVKENKASVSQVNSENYYLEEGDIVIARTGASVGKTYFYEIEDGEFVYAGFLIRIRSNRKILNPLFLKYILRSRKYWDWIGVMSMRSGQPGINGQEIKSFEISIPSPKVQTRIANLLYSMEKEIQSLNLKLQKAKQIKQGMMQDLLTGRVRLV